MKLRCSKTLKVCEIYGEDVDKEEYEYAILSHTWGATGEEVTYQDIESGLKSGDNSHYTSKAGYVKLERFRAEAEQNGIKWIWADTCCIDKTNNVELSEAINSMWTWYAGCKECYAHLADVEAGTEAVDSSGNSGEPSFLQREAFKASNYFNRAWTLQELLAPKKLMFYSEDWQEIGDRTQWTSVITEATGIHQKALDGQVSSLNDFSIAQRMSWAWNRKSTRPEDIAYSLFGIFDVNMPLLYGEGQKKAFWRLQEAIMKESVDQSLFTWEPEIPNRATPIDAEEERTIELVGPLAHHPRLFRNAGNIHWHRVRGRPASSMTGTTGLRLTVPIMQVPNSEDVIALLDCYQIPGDGGDDNQGARLGIYVKEKDIHDEGDQFDRISGLLAKDTDNSWERSKHTIRTICLSKDIVTPNLNFVHPSRIKAFEVHILHPGSFETKKNMFHAPDSTTYNKFEGPNWHAVCLLKEKEHPRRSGRKKDFWLIMGYDHTTDLPWCDILPHDGEDIHRIWSEVRNGPGSTEAKLKRKRLRKHLTVCVSMEEKDEIPKGIIIEMLSGEEVPTTQQPTSEADGRESNGDVIEMTETGKGVKDSSLARFSARSEMSRKAETKMIITVVVRPHYWWFESLDRKLQALRTKVEVAIRKFFSSRLVWLFRDER